ncbi:MAG: hypothetical protein IPK19_13800 [Chloroflexi bacterium]|nr:hypothetical protein [Chloroflexota bacterium]
MKRISALFSMVAVLLLTVGVLSAQEATEEPPMMNAPTLYVSLNPADLANDSIVAVRPDMMMSDEVGDMMSESMHMFGGFDGITSVQSVDFTSEGTAYVTVDVAEGQGGILVVEDMGMSESMSVGMGTRLITGTSQAGLVSPKGLDIIEALDLVLVANFGANNIKGFSLSADGDTTPTVFIDNFGGASGSIWDVHYDAETDMLFAAGTSGTLLVYGSFSADLGANGPTSLIVPSDADGNQISVNLHGVDYDAASDTVILTDVGSADDATDGQIFTIASVSMASGNTPVTTAISGAESMLGNPVDVVFDGTGAYVAEKSNDVILYYADILDWMGMMMGEDGAATGMIAITKPESVTLLGGDMMMEGM